MRRILLTLGCVALAGSAFGADEATIQHGEKVFDYWCATCHGSGNVPGTVALQVKYKEVMKQYGLGPNGGILTSLNLFATRFDQVRWF